MSEILINVAVDSLFRRRQADVQKWRVENYNLEKRPRKFNSWVANRAKEEYQADLFFFDDLKQRDEEPAKYNAGLLVVDTFSKKIAVVPVEGKKAGDLGDALKKAFGNEGVSRKCYTRTRSRG